MTNDSSDILAYLNSLGDKLSQRKVIKRPLSDIKDFPLSNGQCFYVMDFKTRKLTYQKGIKDFLGYDESEFTFDLVAQYFHPDDYEVVTRLIKATLMFASENYVASDVAFFLTYRIKKKNGDYVKVMRQSTTYDLDESGKIISNLSFLTDISFMNTSKQVEWRFEAPGLEKEKFRKYIVKEYKGFFSERENEIIKHVNQGLSSKEIADKLYLSKHTVDTHRRKILNKSQCKNTIELINFCKRNGLI